MANEVQVKERRVGKKVDIGIQRRKDVTETESSIFRRLEKEDLQRFKTTSEEANKVRTSNRRKIHHEDSEKDIRKENNRKYEKTKRSSGKEMMKPKKKRIGRFLQQRICNRISKRWHSDSELLASSTKDASAASRKGKVDESHRGVVKDDIDKNDLVSSHFAKVHQKEASCKEKYHESAEKAECDKAKVDGVRNGHEVEYKQKRMKNDDIFKWMNCSFPATMRDSGIRKNIYEYGALSQHQSGVLNLLIEYFKDLNKEVREFREEKKRTREQIQHIELKIETLVAKLEAQGVTIQCQKGKKVQEMKPVSEDIKIEGNGSRKGEVRQEKAKNNATMRSENVCMELEARPEIRQEIRNILADVHDKYHKQLVEHEKRMKCVQEKAEIDIQDLMKTIIGNYVELSTLRGTEKGLGTLIVPSKSAEEMPKISRNSSESIRSEENKAPTASKMEFCSKRGPAMVVSQDAGSSPPNAGPSKSVKAETIRKSYQFYFPRQTRADHQPLRSTNEDLRRAEAGIGKNAPSCEEMVTTSVGQMNDVGNTAIRATTEDIRSEEAVKVPMDVMAKTRYPQGLGVSYLEWKKYWREKLVKSNSLLKAKREEKVIVCDDNGGGEENTKERIRNNT